MGRSDNKKGYEIRIAFEVKHNGEKQPPGYNFVDLMLILDIKIDFQRKSRMVARGDQTAPPLSITYSSVVSRESVKIAFLVAALNDLDVTMFDIGNAYLMAPAAEKLYTVLGPEFGEDQEKIGVITRAIYGLKSSGAAFRKFFAETLMDLGFKSCLADADVWRKSATKKNGTKYYEYVLTYVDDCLVISENTIWVLEALTKDPYNYKLKDVEEPTKYLGAEIGKFTIGDKQTWYMSARLYLKNAIGEIEQTWGNLSKLFLTGRDMDVPARPKYHP